MVSSKPFVLKWH